MASAFDEVCWLDVRETENLYAELADYGVVGGAVYDALVARAAHVSDRILLTRDRRAERTYRALDIRYEFIE